jgi:hypothetical protein
MEFIFLMHYRRSLKTKKVQNLFRLDPKDLFINIYRNIYMSGLSKTRKRIVDLSGGFPSVVNDRADQFIKFLATNSEDAFTRPWHRLERGMRLNRLRKFADEESTRFNLSETDKTDLFNMLVKALDKKQLNSKSVVNYDVDQQKILEIKGLNFHRTAEGAVIYQISEKRGVTQKRRSAVSQEPKLINQSTIQE